MGKPERIRPRNLPSARRRVVCTRGTLLCRMTVNAGACAAAVGTDATPTRARNARPGLTSKAVVESQRESQGLARRHRLRHVHAHPAPIDTEAEVGEPAAESRQPVRGQAAGSGAHEPRLARIRENHDVRAPQDEWRLRLLVYGPGGAVRPMECDVAAGTRPSGEPPVACR